MSLIWLPVFLLAFLHGTWFCCLYVCDLVENLNLLDFWLWELFVGWIKYVFHSEFVILLVVGCKKAPSTQAIFELHFLPEAFSFKDHTTCVTLGHKLS